MLREGKWLLLACVLVAAGAAGLYSYSKTPEYQSTARILVSQEDIGAAVGLGVQANDPVRESATDLELASSPTLAARVVRKLRLNANPDVLLEKVEAEAQGNSNVLAFTATDTQPIRAARLANAFAREYAAFRAEQDRRRVTRALVGVQRQLDVASRSGIDSVRRRRLEAQAQELELLKSLQTGDVEVIQSARLPTSPSSPKPARNIALGVIFGLLLGTGLAFLRAKLDRRVKREEDVRTLLPGIPIIGSLHLSDSREDMELQVDAFRNLQTNLDFLDEDNSLRSLLVTSGAGGDGKSTTSLNLALAMAEHDDQVILMEADLRRRGLTKRLGLTDRPGLSNLLSGSGPMEEYLEDLSISGSAWNGNKGPGIALSGIVTLLPAGPVPPNPQALLSSPSLDALLAQARKRADKVIIDGTPLGPISDMLHVARRVDGVVLVVRLNHSRRDQLERLKQQLETAGVRPIGIVLFQATAGEPAYRPEM